MLLFCNLLLPSGSTDSLFPASIPLPSCHTEIYNISTLISYSNCVPCRRLSTSEVQSSLFSCDHSACDNSVNRQSGYYAFQMLVLWLPRKVLPHMLLIWFLVSQCLSWRMDSIQFQTKESLTGIQQPLVVQVKVVNFREQQTPYRYMISSSQKST